MSSLLINGILLLVGLVLGGGFGWLASRLSPFASSVTNESAKMNEEMKEAVQALQTREKNADSVLHQLGELAQNIVFDVEEHSQRVSNANDELKKQSKQQLDAAPSLLCAVAKIIEANESLKTRLHTAELKLNEQAKVIATHVKESRTDALTHVANRRAFDTELEAARADLDRDKVPSCVMILDIDRFKNVNDQFGHQAGDEVLRLVAQTLRRTTKSDAQIFRYGGEEFAVLFRARTAAQSIQFAERIRASIGACSFNYDNQRLEVTASGGLAELTLGESSEDSVRRADNALYDAKRGGRNCAFWHDGRNCNRVPTMSSSDAIAAGGETETVRVEATTRSRSEWRKHISNREEFNHDIQRRIAAHKRSGGSDAMILLRVDDLGAIEHSRGADTAELMLRASSQFLKASVREMDHVALYDNHTFAVWLPTASLENAARVGERLRAAVARCKIPASSGALTFTVSVGITELALSDSVNSICDRCEKAMNQSSQRGGNRCFAAKDGAFASVTHDAEICF